MYEFELMKIERLSEHEKEAYFRNGGHIINWPHS